MKIQIISVGKLSSEMSVIADRYQKMISWQLTNLDLMHSKKSSVQEIKFDEAKAIQAKIKANSYLVVLDLRGNQIDSFNFSQLITKQMMVGKDIDFVIGGAYGLDDSIVAIANYKLSLSALTFPHQLAKILLLEQIYRAQTIINQHPYHK